MNTIQKRGILQAAGCSLFLVVSAVLLAAAGSPRIPQAAQQPASNQLVFAIEPAKCTVHWILDTTLHTVHGTFALTRGELRLNPASSKAEGEIVVDATSGASGNDSRDKRMHKEIIESARFTEIIFKPDRVDGKVPAQGSVDLQVHGVFSLHGSDHEMTLPVHAEITGNAWKGTGKLSIPYIQWGLKNPSNFLLKVKPDVEIELEMTGTLRDNSNK
jgi:polyisoprenoid-binding protein YceI